MIDQPIEHCYWVSPGKLLAGEYPGSKGEDFAKLKINALIAMGVGPQQHIEILKKRSNFALNKVLNGHF